MININDRQDRCPGIEIPQTVSFLDGDGHRFLLPLAMVGVKTVKKVVEDVEIDDDSIIFNNSVESTIMVSYSAESGNILALNKIRPDFKINIATMKSAGDILIIPESKAEEFWAQPNIPDYKEYYTFTPHGIHYVNDKTKYIKPELSSEPSNIRTYVRDLLMVYFIVNRNIRHENNGFLVYDMFKMGVTGALMESLDTFFNRYKDFEPNIEGVLE